MQMAMASPMAGSINRNPKYQGQNSPVGSVRGVSAFVCSVLFGCSALYVPTHMFSPHVQGFPTVLLESSRRDLRSLTGGDLKNGFEIEKLEPCSDCHFQRRWCRWVLPISPTPLVEVDGCIGSLQRRMMQWKRTWGGGNSLLSLWYALFL